MSLTETMPTYQPLTVDQEERSPRGKRMPDTREQYEIMADAFEKALLREKEINSKLRAQVNDLTNKLNRRG